jgi:D-alanyl-lipoteichoic acid acyltransferase DltB (MBOAT superfamily)
MVLGGLWHGPKWTFVIWGGLHGVALACNRALRARFGDHLKRTALSLWCSRACTFHFVLFCWVFFRADSLRSARAVFGELRTLTAYHPNLDARVLAVLACGLAMHFLPQKLELAARARFSRLPGALQGLALFAVLLLVRKMASAEAVPFVYFQF